MAALLVTSADAVGRPPAPRPQMERGTCASDLPLSASHTLPGVGDGNPVHLHVIGQLHPSVDSEAHVTSIAACQARVYTTILHLARTRDVSLVSAEGVPWMAAPPDAWDGDATVCDAATHDEARATDVLGYDGSPVQVLGWEDPFLHGVGSHHLRKRSRLRRWKMDRLDELATAVADARDAHDAVEDQFHALARYTPHLTDSEVDAVGIGLAAVYGEGSEEVRLFAQASKRPPEGPRPGSLTAEVRSFVSAVSRWEGRTAAAEADLAALDSLSRWADGSQDWSSAVLGPNALARSGAAVSNTIGAMEMVGAHDAVLVIGAGHLDDLVQMRSAASSWPAMTFYSCGTSPAPVAALPP